MHSFCSVRHLYNIVGSITIYILVEYQYALHNHGIRIPTHQKTPTLNAVINIHLISPHFISYPTHISLIPVGTPLSEYPSRIQQDLSHSLSMNTHLVSSEISLIPSQ